MVWVRVNRQPYKVARVVGLNLNLIVQSGFSGTFFGGFRFADRPEVVCQEGESESDYVREMELKNNI